MSIIHLEPPTLSSYSPLVSHLNYFHLGSQPSSYGVKFLIPFPEVDAADAQFTYRIFLTNPNPVTVAVDVTQSDSQATITTTYDIMASSSEVAIIPHSFMMLGKLRYAMKSLMMVGEVVVVELADIAVLV